MYQASRSQPTIPINVSRVLASNTSTTTIAATACIACRKRKLRCDRLKPKCGTCSRTKYECEFPSPIRKIASKRQSTKDLEARLAHVETRLNPKETSSVIQHTTNDNLSNSEISLNWRDGSSPGLSANSTAEIKFQSAMEERRRRESSPQFLERPAQTTPHLLSMRLEESFLPESVQHDLFQIYFSQVHCYVPMTHKPRFLAALKLEFRQRPPKCLQYAMWALAASVSQKYNNFCNFLYERAREYSMADELKAESSLTVYHAQSWHLIATFEAQKANLARSWMSTGRCVRLVQLMGLQCVDDPRGEINALPKALPKPQDPAELEERRRTFWAAYFGDRWASAGSGWPMSITESEVFTRLPMSELAFENGTDEENPFLPETLIGDGASKLASPFAAILIAATLFGRNFEHIYDKPKADSSTNTKDGDFWRRHREFDNILSSTFMHLPEHLKLSGGLQDLRTLFLHMSLHTSVISLHKAAVIIAIKNRLGPTLITRSVSRCIIAANEICNMMKTISHHDVTKMNPWTGCALYIAGRVYCHDIRVSGPTKLESSSNLEYILSAMNEIMKRNSFIRLFTTQLESELRVARHAAVYQERGVIGEILSTSPSNTCYLLNNSRSTDTDTAVNINESSEFEGDIPLFLPESNSRPPLSGIFIEDDPDAKSCPSEQLADHGNEQRTDFNECEGTSCKSHQDPQLKTHIPESFPGRPPAHPSNNSSISFSSRSTLHTEQNPTEFVREFTQTKKTETFQGALTSTEQTFNHNDPSAVRNRRIHNQALTKMPAQYLPSNYGTTQPNFYSVKDQRRTNYDIWSSQRQEFYSVDEGRNTGIDGMVPDDYSMELDA